MSDTTLHLGIQELSPEVIRDLQEKYPEAEIELTVRRGSTLKRLSEAVFWEIIGLLDWAETGDDDAVLKPAIVRLAGLPVGFIYQFADLLAEKLYALDTRRHAEQMGESAYKNEEHFSVDEFLYTRCAVVANGQAYYETVLYDPMQMPKDLDFESLLNLSADAYEIKTGKEFNYVATYSYETFSNRKGWH